MSENSFVSIRNATIASVIAGVILLGVPILRGYLIKVLSWFLSVAVWCWTLLIDSYSLPGWAWILILTFSLIGIVNIYRTLKKSVAVPDFKSYTEDVIHGAIWRWRWVENKITDLWCYCPTCDAILIYDDYSCYHYSDIDKTDFICENCKHKVVASITGGNKDYAVSAVMREVDRRIRTGEYNRH